MSANTSSHLRRNHTHCFKRAEDATLKVLYLTLIELVGIEDTRTAVGMLRRTLFASKRVHVGEEPFEIWQLLEFCAEQSLCIGERAK